MAAPTAPVREYGDIPPAQSREAWAGWQRIRDEELALSGEQLTDHREKKLANIHVTIAAQNIASLPDADRRKFSWDYVDKLRDIASRLLDPLQAKEYGHDLDNQLARTTDGLALASMADVVASYLPPRQS